MAACVLASAALSYFRRHWPALLLAWIGFGLSGILFAHLEQLPPPQDHLKSLAIDQRLDINRPLQLRGWVSKPAQARPGSYSFDLTTEAVLQDGTETPANGTVRVYYYTHGKDDEQETTLQLPYGTRITITTGNLRAPRNYGNPGLFDYVSSMHRQGIYYTSLLRNRESDLAMLPGNSGEPVEAMILRGREAMIASIERLTPNNRKTQSILKAMLLGDDNWLDETTEEAFQRSGTYHVLVISGWNVAVFAGPLLLLLSRPRVPNWLSSLLVFLTVISFALIAQWEIPIVRASIMFLIYLFSRLFYRHRALTNSLAAAALLLLVLHPSDLFDWGFQLSFLAVLTLSTIALPTVEWKLTPYRRALPELAAPRHDLRYSPAQSQFRMDLRSLFHAIAATATAHEAKRARLAEWQRWLAWGTLAVMEALCFTALMQVGYALVTAYYFHRLTWSGILGNLLILPIASCIVLLGMTVIPIEMVFPLAGKMLSPVISALCTGLEAIAKFSSEIGALSFRVPTPPAWLAVAFIVASISLALLVAARSRYATLAGLALLLACLGLSYPTPRNGCTPGKLELTALDVGQGDALLVCFPGGSTMLVDAGGTIPIPGSPVRRQDIGETVVSSYLWERGISTIDYVVLSHDHFDHMGGLPTVFENFKVGEFWMGPDAHGRSMEWLRKRAAGSGAKVLWPTRASAAPRQIEGVAVSVLSPPADWAPARVSNNDSIVLQLTYGKRRFLLAGDIESKMERVLVEGDAALRSDVLKVAHHGSRTSSIPEFIERVSPAISLVSVGAYGRFGHPNQGVLQRLSAGTRLVYITPRAGAITVRTDGNRLETETYHEQDSRWSG